MKGIILNKATEMFLSLGFKSVTMDDLAHELAISKKTIYSHFKNKSELIKACTLSLFESIIQGIEEIQDLKLNPIQELYEIKKFVLLHLNDEKSSPQYQLQKYYPKINESIKVKQFDMMLGCVIENIERGIALGIYRENLNTEFVAKIYFSGIQTIKDQHLFPVTKFPIVTLMDIYLEYHLRGIVTPEGRKILNTIINSNHE